MNPLIQIFKPVSPLAWLPIVTMIVSATYVTVDDGLVFQELPDLGHHRDPLFALADSDQHLSGCGIHRQGSGERLQGSENEHLWTKITKLVLPSALPLIFTGLRLSLGVGWMVLIAAEMLAQNPGSGQIRLG